MFWALYLCILAIHAYTKSNLAMSIKWIGIYLHPQPKLSLLYNRYRPFFKFNKVLRYSNFHRTIFGHIYLLKKVNNINSYLFMCIAPKMFHQRCSNRSAHDVWPMHRSPAINYQGSSSISHLRHHRYYCVTVTKKIKIMFHQPNGIAATHVPYTTVVYLRCFSRPSLAAFHHRWMHCMRMVRIRPQLRKSM